MKIPCKKIPTYDATLKQWSETSFNEQQEFGDFLRNVCFKEPGEYELDESCKDFTLANRHFLEHGVYTLYSRGTSEYNDFWDFEEKKCRLGVIWKNNNKTWYLTRDYYFLLNYCPILNKEKGNIEAFMSIRDVQLHMMLYEKIAECFHLHSCILKRRQMAYSNCHAAKSLNFVWFENKKTIKWFASDDAYLNNVNGSWKMLDAFRNHLNANTDWIRVFTPAEYPEMQQKEKFQIRKGQWATKGNESTLVAKTLKRDVTSGVGGAAYWVWHEEGGVAPKADDTLQYLNPALESGLEKSGSFHIGGSVGDLEDCKPLKDFLLKPEIYEMYAVPTKWYDKSKIEKQCGLFIPAQYGMPQAVDEFGNSLVEKALQLLEQAEEQWKLLPPEQYILRKSQNPKNIQEAFAWRKTSFFNVQRVERRQKAIELLIESGKLNFSKGLLYENNEGEIKLKRLEDFPDYDRPVEIGYPVDPKIIDKRGCVTIFETPEDEPNLYYAGVDSVEVGATETSDSLFSMHIYKRGHKRVIIKSNGEKSIEHVRGKIVASYRGRFNNPDDHNEQGLFLLRMYRALAACERNKPNFINYCRRKNYGHLIARKSQMPFDKDLDVTGGKNDEFGIWNDSAGKLLNIMKNTTYEYLDADIDTIHEKSSDNEIGKIVKTIRGYDLVDDYIYLEEIKLWNQDDNFDAFISGALALILGISRELDYEKTTTIIEESDKPKVHKDIKPKSLLTSSFTSKKSLLSY